MSHALLCLAVGPRRDVFSLWTGLISPEVMVKYYIEPLLEWYAANPSRRPRSCTGIENRVLWAFMVLHRDLSYRELHKLVSINGVYEPSEQALGELILNTFLHLKEALAASVYRIRLPTIPEWRQRNHGTGKVLTRARILKGNLHRV